MAAEIFRTVITGGNTDLNNIPVFKLSDETEGANPITERRSVRERLEEKKQIVKEREERKREEKAERDDGEEQGDGDRDHSDHSEDGDGIEI